MDKEVKEIIRTIFSYLFIIIAVIFIRIFIVDPVRVEGPSMNTTLANGEILLLNKIAYIRHDIKRFDIVVIKSNNKLIIKRVIGLPGETIKYQDNVLYVNNKKLDDPYPSTATDDFSIEDIGHIKVPGDTYFVMGDNRSDSLDSRYPSVGVIKKNQILGKAKLVLWPIKRFGFVK